MYLNVFIYWRYLLKQIWKVNAIQYTSINAHSYKVVMYTKKLPHFCNTSALDDGPSLDRRYLRDNLVKSQAESYQRLKNGTWCDLD